MASEDQGLESGPTDPQAPFNEEFNPTIRV